ncbi:hypothetical protein C9374_009425 [Naegleria lovaniensis]|uniref:Tetratricopeptide SHNi-TPR domain-containing protein n=1 Tax=Naegleria lovaniensis TaxID=51637 RepID=A0AA88H185_NAELO|nr:uncharacterized protein C9374_009425 [Naegleria lovaniensis]KAG2392848.1 hypothetical protein C9374_009425 [Naegleria lovaniensis]
MAEEHEANHIPTAADDLAEIDEVVADAFEENIEEEEDIGGEELPNSTNEISLQDHLVMNQDALLKALDNYSEYKRRVNASEKQLEGEALEEALTFLDEAIEIFGNQIVRDREEQFGESSVECGEILIPYAEMLIARGKYQADNLVSKQVTSAIKKRKMKEQGYSEDEEFEEEEEEDCFEVAWGVLELARVSMLRYLVSGNVSSPSEMQLNYRMKLARVHSLLGELSAETDMFSQAVLEYRKALQIYEKALEESDDIGFNLFRLAANIFHKRDDFKVDLLQKIAEANLEIANCLTTDGIEGEEVLELYEKAEKALQQSVELRQKAIENDKSIVSDLNERIVEMRNTIIQAKQGGIPSPERIDARKLFSEVITNRMGSTQLGFSNSRTNTGSSSSHEEQSEVHILQPRKRKLDQSSVVEDSTATSSSDTKKTKQ